MAIKCRLNRKTSSGYEALDIVNSDYESRISALESASGSGGVVTLFDDDVTLDNCSISATSSSGAERLLVSIMDSTLCSPYRIIILDFILYQGAQLWTTANKATDIILNLGTSIGTMTTYNMDYDTMFLVSLTATNTADNPKITARDAIGATVYRTHVSDKPFIEASNYPDYSSRINLGSKSNSFTIRSDYPIGIFGYCESSPTYINAQTHVRVRAI